MVEPPNEPTLTFLSSNFLLFDIIKNTQLFTAHFTGFLFLAADNIQSDTLFESISRNMDKERFTEKEVRTKSSQKLKCKV